MHTYLCTYIDDNDNGGVIKPTWCKLFYSRIAVGVYIYIAYWFFNPSARTFEVLLMLSTVSNVIRLPFQTHKSLSLKKFSRFSKWLTNWKSRNVTEKNEDACCEWLDGRLEETCGKTIRHSEGSSSQLPYHSYVKYSVEADDCVNSSGST